MQAMPLVAVFWYAGNTLLQCGSLTMRELDLAVRSAFWAGSERKHFFV
jgi:hypothetical protein